MNILLAHGFGIPFAQKPKKTKLSMDIDDFISHLRPIDVDEILGIDDIKRNKVHEKLSKLTPYEMKCYYRHFMNDFTDE